MQRAMAESTRTIHLVTTDESLLATSRAAVSGLEGWEFDSLDSAEALAETGTDVAVVNCRFLKPLDTSMLADLLEQHRVLVTVEDGTIVNGFGTLVASHAAVPRGP